MSNERIPADVLAHAKTAASNPSDQTVAAREHTITRVFNVPARILFEAHSKPEHVKRWFGPKPYPLTMCEMDFRSGGTYRFAMTGPDGVQNLPFGGTYIVIEKDRVVQYTNRFEDPSAEEMLVTNYFEEKNGKTTLRMQTVFGSTTMKNEHMKAGFNEGVNIGLDQMAEVVATMK